jgi:hypothetical protein
MPTILTRSPTAFRSPFADTLPAVHRAPRRDPSTLPDRGPAPAGDTTRDDPGYGLGWEHARYGQLPPTAHLHPLSPVRQGWEAGRLAFAGRTRPADAAVRHCLHLRQVSWLAGIGFDELQVTPALLRRIATEACPVTREPFSVDGDGAAAAGGSAVAAVTALPTPVWREAGCAAGNLALVSPRAAKVLVQADARSALAQAEAMRPDDVHTGLSGREWRRLATLLSFVTPLAHGLVASWAMTVLPTPRLRLLNPAQGLQCLVSLQTPGAGQARRDGLLAALLPHAEARYALADLQSTMLARRKAPARAGEARAQREAIEDLWTDGLVLRRWQRLVSRLSAADCEAIVRVAVARGAAGERLQWLPDTVATAGWGAAAHA